MAVITMFDNITDALKGVCYEFFLFLQNHLAMLIILIAMACTLFGIVGSICYI